MSHLLLIKLTLSPSFKISMPVYFFLSYLDCILGRHFGSTHEDEFVKDMKERRSAQLLGIFYNNMHAWQIFFICMLRLIISLASLQTIFTHAHLALCNALWHDIKRRREKKENVQLSNHMNACVTFKCRYEHFLYLSNSLYVLLHFKAFMHTFSKKVNGMQYMLVHNWGGVWNAINDIGDKIEVLLLRNKGVA